MKCFFEGGGLMANYDAAMLAISGALGALETLRQRVQRDDGVMHETIIDRVAPVVDDVRALIVDANKSFAAAVPVVRDAPEMIACNECGRTAPATTRGMKCNAGGGECVGEFL